MTRRLALLQRGRNREDGFTLIEAVAALAIATIILTGLAFATVGGVKGSTMARINQQAADVLESTIESVRTQGYGSVVMYDGDPDLTPSKDSRLLTSGCLSAGMCISLPKHDGSGTTKEDLVTSPAPGFAPNHITTVTNGTNHVPFTVATYVTTPLDEATGASYKRVTVFVSWTQYGSKHVRSGSTFVTNTVRGLPLPRFTLTPTTYAPTSQTGLVAGATVVVGLMLQNLGARDAFDITTSDPTLAWKFYADDGTTPIGYSDTDDPQLQDIDADAVKDTGLVGTNNYFLIWAVGKVPTSAVTGQVYTTTITARSVAEPHASTASQSQPVSIGIGSGTQVTTPPVTTPPVTTPPVTTPPVTTPPVTTPPNPCDGIISNSATSVTPGYFLDSTGNFTSTDPGNTTTPASVSLGHPSNFSYDKNDNYNGSSAPVARWYYRWQTSTNPTIFGPANVAIWVNSSAAVNLTAYLGINTGSKWESLGSATATGTGCGNWQEVLIKINLVSGRTIASGNQLQVVLVNNNSTSIQYSVGRDVGAYPNFSATDSTHIPASVAFPNGIHN